MPPAPVRSCLPVPLRDTGQRFIAAYVRYLTEAEQKCWEAMVDDITGALDNLGTLDRVTTERLFAVLFDQLRRAGIH